MILPHGWQWTDLVHHQRNTDVQTQSDASGVAQTRGFIGKYEITVTAVAKTKVVPAKLVREGTHVKIVLE